MWMPTENDECNRMALAHSYVPWQYYNSAFCPQEALMKGTLFPELYGPYMPPK
jgi:hypothetical protein